MHLQENNIKNNKELYLVILTKSQISFNKKWEINGNLLKKINNFKLKKSLSYSKSIKIQLKLINQLLQLLKYKKPKSFFMTVLKSYYKLKEIQINQSRKVTICQKGQNNFTKHLKRWTVNVVRLYDPLYFSYTVH